TARIEAGRLELRLEERDFRKVVVETLAGLPVGDRHEILPWMPDEPVAILCDAMRIGQVLNNLISNARKYSPAGGRGWGGLHVRGAEAVLCVADEGIAIPPEEHNRIFEPFQRAVPQDGLIQGVGLGLSVARRIVEAHGGRIELDSRPGVGSEFRVRLPFTT